MSEISKEEAVTDINNISEISNDTMTDDNKEAEDEDDFLLKQEMASMNNLQVIQYFLKQIIDLKEFMSYEVNKLKNNTSYELIKQLREENNFFEK